MVRLKGQSLVEYGLTALLLLTITIGALTLLGQNISGGFNSLLSPSNQVAISSAPTGSLATAEQSEGFPTSPPVEGSLPRPITLETLPQTAEEFIMTAGANGAGRTTLAFTEIMMQSAQAYQQSDPATYNAIVKLGLKGQEMAKMMQHCEAGACNTASLEHLQNEFHDIYYNEIRMTNLYRQIKTEDFKLIANLTNQSEALASDVITIKQGTYAPDLYHAFISDADGEITRYPVGQSILNASSTVHGNSTTTKQCGLAMACPK